jgi:hypothetical protein
MICMKLYCSSCFHLDTDFRNGKKNLKLISNKDYEYCCDCRLYFNLECQKAKNNINQHSNHKIIKISNMVPNHFKIIKMKEKISAKKKSF